MKLSVVMPVYNVEKYINECIDSVLNQTMRDFELIVVDDGSTDSSGLILDEYQAKDNRVTVIHKKNEGVSAARNDALEKCQGEYIYIMDSDDYLEADAFQVMYDEITRTGADVVITDHYKFAIPGERREFHYFPKDFVTEDHDVIMELQKMVFHKGYAPYFTEENNGMGIGAPWTKLIKKELIENNHLRFDPYVRGVFDDCLFSLAVFEYAKKVAYTRELTYNFRVVQSSLTHRFRNNQLEIYSRIFERIRDFSTSHHKKEDFLKAYYARVILYLGMSFDTYFFNSGYTGGKKKNFHEFVETIKSEVYHTAIQKVEVNRLRKREKIIVIFSKMHLEWLLWLLYTVKHVVK